MGLVSLAFIQSVREDMQMPDHPEHDTIQVGAVLERVLFEHRRIVLGFDTGERAIEVASSLYRRGRVYKRSQQAFASQLVAQIGQRVRSVAIDDAHAKLAVTFANDAVLRLGEAPSSTPAKRVRRTAT